MPDCCQVPWATAYEVDTDGNIRRLYTCGRHKAGLLLKPFIKNGYNAVTIRINDGTKAHEYIHRIVARVFLGEPPSNDHQVAHFDGNKRNNSVKNLRWATRKENLADCLRHGTDRRGTKSPTCRMTEKSVLEIRQSQEPQRVLALKYGVHQSHISRIKSGVHNCWNVPQCQV